MSLLTRLWRVVRVPLCEREISFRNRRGGEAATHEDRVDLLDETIGFARTETSDIREEVVVVGVANGLVDVNAETVDDLDEGLLEVRNELLGRELWVTSEVSYVLVGGPRAAKLTNF